MSVNLSLLGGAGWQFFTDNGTPLAGGLLYTYLAGTSTAATTYTTSAGNVPNSNPIVLNSAGRVQTEIWLTQGVSYKFVLKTSAFITIGTYDNIDGAADPAPFYAFEAALAASSGSSLVGFIQSGSGAVATTVQAKLRETVSVMDFGAVGDGVTDDSDAIQAALDSVPVGGASIYFPSGNYKLSKGLNILIDQTTLLGAGKFNTELSPLPSFDRVTYDALVTIGDGTSTDVGANCVIQNMSIISTYNNDGDNVSGVCNNNYYNTDIINCELKGGNPDTRETGGIFIKRGLHIRVIDSSFYNGYGYGALLSGGNDITFSNCAFDETQAGIVTDNNVFRMRIENCVFGNLVNNSGYPAAKTGSMIDLTTGSHDVVQIIDCVFEGNISNTYTNYGVNSNNVDTLIVQGCRFTDMRRMAVCKRDNKAMMVLNNYFYNCGWGGATFDATLGTTNPDTTPFVPDIYSVGASTNATLIVGNRTATNVRVMSWLEGSVSGPLSSECNIVGNFASGGAAYVRGVYAYDANLFSLGYISPKSAPPITVAVTGFTIGANATVTATFAYSYADDDSILLGSVQSGALNTALTFRVEPVSGATCRYVISNTTSGSIVQADFNITVSLILNQ